MLDNGMAMDDIDRIEYKLYMQIVRERAQRRARRENRDADVDGSGGRATVILRRGYIDDVW